MRRSLRYSGVVAVATVWSTFSAAALVSGFDLTGPDPLSYLGTRRPSAALFTVGMAVTAVLLAAFHRWVRDSFPVSTGFSVAMLVGLAGQMVSAFVPIGGDPTIHRIHTTSALILGVSLPLLMWRFAASQPPGAWRRLAYRLFWAEVAACAVGLYLSARGVAPVAEILPAAAFHAWVLTLTFATGSRSGRSGVVEGRLEGGDQAGRVDARAGGHGREGGSGGGPVVIGEGEEVEQGLRTPRHQGATLEQRAGAGSALADADHLGSPHGDLARAEAGEADRR